ncbi:DUF6083 domain-containing protein [Streptomyces odonnellii]|uniref:DUF6083 domain-containing protein n=1 Tax=Streptomyces odonnellii TaxID=1417980 RepID=UPI000ABC5F53|nr:DUF6083 domain-containing protein [Streptomyces odonnellii]
MHSTPAPAGRHWDGTRTHVRRARSLGIAPASPSRLLRTGQNGRCTACGNLVEWYDRTGHPPIGLHPRELAVTAVPVPCRWHVSSGIAHPVGDGTPWCRILHRLLCPACNPPAALTPQLTELRRHLALRTRRLTDSGAFTLASARTRTAEPASTPDVCRPNRPVVQLLYGRYLAARPVEDIQCVAQTRRRHRCIRSVLDLARPGTWILLPTGPATGQRALPDVLIAVYDLSPLPYAEQLRWRTQRCPSHAATPAAADLAHADWEVFDPLLHHQYIATRFPATGWRRTRREHQPLLPPQSDDSTGLLPYGGV